MGQLNVRKVWIIFANVGQLGVQRVGTEVPFLFFALYEFSFIFCTLRVGIIFANMGQLGVQEVGAEVPVLLFFALYEFELFFTLYEFDLNCIYIFCTL